MKKKIFKNISMFILYFIYDVIIGIIISILNFNVSEWNNFDKSLYLICTNALYLIFMIIIYREELITDLKGFKINGAKYLLKYIPIYILGVAMMGVSNIILYKITDIEISNNENLIREYIKIFPIYMTFSTVVYAPIVEEITFRKTFRNIIDNKYLYIIVSGIMFGLVHITGENIGINDYILSIPYIIMGIDFAYIYYKSDNIFSTIAIHSMHNFILLMIQFIGG